MANKCVTAISCQDEHDEHFFKQCSLHRPAVTGLSPTTLVDSKRLHRATDCLPFDLFALIHCPNVFAIASQCFTSDLRFSPFASAM